jgi:glycosyltransferase involved in cell wall biosynthesis
VWADRVELVAVQVKGWHVVQVPGNTPRAGWRIGIDAVWAEGNPSGTGMYTSELIRALVRTDPHNTYYIYFRDPEAAEANLRVFEAPNLVKRVVKGSPRNLRNQLLARHLSRDRIDLFHSTGFYLPYLWRGRKVVTFHDANFVRFQQFWWRPGTRFSYLTLRAQTPLSSAQSRFVVTVSHTAARDIAQYLHVPDKKLRVIYPGVRTDLDPNPPHEAVAATLARYTLERGRYLLYVGVLAPHKNLERLVKAFAASRDESDETTVLGQSGPFKLVLAGKSDGPYANEVIRPLVKSLGCDDVVVFTGYVSNEELNHLYVAARAAAQISEAEGFGLPVLEAMACGAPVIVSDATATAEAAGDAALLVSPTDVERIAEAIAHVRDDDASWQNLRQRGLERARHFTWDEAARHMLRLYEEAIIGVPER